LLTSAVLTGANFNELTALHDSEPNHAVSAPGPISGAAFTRESLRLHTVGASQGKHPDTIGGEAITPPKVSNSRLIVFGGGLFGQSGLALAESGRSPPLSKI
jgi:hypothetical protein